MRTKPLSFLFITLIGIYLVTRVVNLTILPIFNDEAIYLNWSQTITEHPRQLFIPLSDGKQPLFMWLSALTSVKQQWLFPAADPLFFARSVSVFAGLISIIGMYLIARKLVNEKVGLVAAVLYIVTPIMLFYDRFAVPDDLLATTSIWSLLLAIWLVEKPTKRNALLLGLSIGLGMLTKSPAIFFVACLPLIAIIYAWKKDHWKHHLKMYAINFIIAIATAFILQSGMRVSSLYPVIAQRQPDFVFSLSRIFVHPLDPFVPRIFDVSNWLLAYLTWPIVLLALVGLAIGIKLRKRFVWVLLVWFLLPLLVEMEYAKAFTPRYFLFTLPPFIILATFGFYWLAERIRTSWALPALMLLLVPAILFDYDLLTAPERAPIPPIERSVYLESWSSGYGLKEIATTLKQVAKQKNVLVGTEGHFGALPDGLVVYTRKTSHIDIEGMGQDADIKTVPQPLEDWVNGDVNHRAYLVVNASRMLVQYPTNLQLIKMYPKPVGPNGQEVLLFYEVLPKD